jgi:hypothetical protein
VSIETPGSVEFRLLHILEMLTKEERAVPKYWQGY